MNEELELVRRQAVRLVCDAHARDQIGFEDFEGRLDRLRRAPNEASIEALIADLPEAALYPVPLSPAPLAAEDDDPDTAPVAPAEFLRISSVFASTKRAGSWTVPLELHALVILGELSLDLRDAVFASDVVDIEVQATLGSFKLIVPAGTQVENEIEETLSGSEHSTRSARGARPNGLLIRLRGKALLASVEVKERFPTALAEGQGGFWRRLLSKGER